MAEVSCGRSVRESLTRCSLQCDHEAVNASDSSKNDKKLAKFCQVAPIAPDV